MLLAVAALLATTAGAARPDAPTQRIAETGAPAADAAPAAAAPAATAAAPLLRADQCEPLGQVRGRRRGRRAARAASQRRMQRGASCPCPMCFLLQI